MVGFIYAGYPNRVPGDEKLPQCVAWETSNLHGEDPIVRSGYADPRGFPALVRRSFHSDGTLAMVYRGYFLVAVPEDYETQLTSEEFRHRVEVISGGCPAGWNVAEVQVRDFLLHHPERIPNGRIGSHLET